MNRTGCLARIAIILIFLVSACAPAGGVNPEPATPVDEQPADTVGIVLRRSGGFAGVNQEWRVMMDGRVIAREGDGTPEITQIPAQGVQELLAWMDANGFFSAQVATPNPDEQCCDRFVYELTAVYGSRTNTITVIDTPENLPPDLAEAFRRTLELLGVEFS